MFVCLECGRKFKTAQAAEKAANDGCPKCGGVDIDIDDDLPADPPAQDHSDPPAPERPEGGAS
jgi:hypothetical protein